MALAVREEDICCRFVERLETCGLIDEQQLRVETACIPKRCAYCQQRLPNVGDEAMELELFLQSQSGPLSDRAT